MDRLVRNSLCSVLALASVACATAPNQTVEQKEGKYYRTGSRIPVKDADSGYSKSIDVQSVQDEMRTSGGRTIRPPGN
jgi:hypothetical protein